MCCEVGVADMVCPSVKGSTDLTEGAVKSVKSKLCSLTDLLFGKDVRFCLQKRHSKPVVRLVFVQENDPMAGWSKALWPLLATATFVMV